MEDNINTILQNNGFVPNKEMSNIYYTAYNIDMYGKETVLDNLIINNAKNKWYDKTNKEGGTIYPLLIKLGYVNTYVQAVKFINGFTKLINPWISTSIEKPEQNTKKLAYQDEMIELIYNLQSFVFMTKEFFNNRKYGRNYIENFDFNQLIINDDFKEYFLSLQQQEQKREKNRSNILKQRKLNKIQAFKDLKETSKELGKLLKQIKQS